MVPTSSVPPVSASVPQAKATSASPLLAVTKRQKKHCNVSKFGAKADKFFIIQLIFRETKAGFADFIFANKAPVLVHDFVTNDTLHQNDWIKRQKVRKGYLLPFKSLHFVNRLRF